jgi:hypothetical protein
VKIGLLIDRGRVASWQADALRAIAEPSRFFIYDCSNSRSHRTRLAHAVYYGLNLLAVRNPLTRRVPVPAELQIDRRTSFEAEPSGAWEQLPSALLDQISEDSPEIIIKFGMGLLRVPPKLACPILSYHHGDPRQYRGRPAGFYEIMNGATEIGQVVQILSNQLDAGAVVAFAETKAHRHSWRQSLMEAYRVSPLLLSQAIRNARIGRTLAMNPKGRNYRLPSNVTALHFIARSIAAWLRRLAYGAFVEKRWKAAGAALPDDWRIENLHSLVDASTWRTMPIPECYRFLADPFFGPGDAILAEGMRPSGLGEIVSFNGVECSALPIAGGHCSYPSTLEFEGRQLLLPETSDWSGPMLFEFTPNGLEHRCALDVSGRPRLLDPTLFEHRGRWFLFGNRADEGDKVLRLWFADSPFGAFCEHPDSPICLSPAGGRMAGSILNHAGRRYRPGQDLRGSYGDGLLLFEIVELSPGAYRESQCLDLRFGHRGGPHTLNIRANNVLFDYYDERLSAVAGLRRLRQSRAR